MADDLRADRFATQRAAPRGFELAYLDEGRGAVLLLVHGWPETRRIWWRNVAPLVEARFRVIAPDLRGFGDSASAPDGFGDVPARSRDLHALVHDPLGVRRVVAVAGDLGGAVIQDRMAAAVFPDHVGPFLVRDAGHFLQWEAAAVRNGAAWVFARGLTR